MSDGVRLAVFATIAESHGFNPWECVNVLSATSRELNQMSSRRLNGFLRAIGEKGCDRQATQ
jgi:hypothetical protein